MNIVRVNAGFAAPLLIQVVLAVLTLGGVVPVGWAEEFYVSTSGNDKNPGTLARPWLSVAKGVSQLKAGDILYLRQGAYVASDPVVIARKQGTSARPIVIQSYRREHASIDGILSKRNFHQLNNGEWVPASQLDAHAHPDEYVSKATFVQANDDPVNQGSFIDREPYTRLITYSRLEDMRATNETFDRILAGDPREGPQVMVACEDGQDEGCVPGPEGKPYRLAGYRHPWVYMGPGLFFNRASGRIHIRLSHTHNNISGLEDYTGEVDPNKVRLAIANKGLNTLTVQNSKHIHFQNVSLRYGGTETLRLTEVEGLMFDHVQILASRIGARMGNNVNTSFSNCEVNGGLPTWYFRSDKKSDYVFNDGGAVVPNGLGGQTLVSLLLGSNGDTGTSIEHCEFVNGHDMYLIGSDLEFHHNWIHNLNDEGMFLDGGFVTNLRVHENVITNVLNPISFAGGCSKNSPEYPECEHRVIGGPRYIYRNLIDLRGPTAGYRPRCNEPIKACGQNDVWRFGNSTKSNSPDGPYDLFQNTFLVYKQTTQASYLHYRNTDPPRHRRRSLNNIFIAVNPDVFSDVAMAFLPPPDFPAATNGNDYHRIGFATAPLFRYLTENCPVGGCVFQDLNALHSSCPSPYCMFEANSLEADPKFREIGADGIFRTTDDLRLLAASPAVSAGVKLPKDLYELDPLRSDTPDIGCFAFGSGPLRVGVDGRRSHPN